MMRATWTVVLVAGAFACTPEQQAENAEKKLEKQMTENTEERRDLADKQAKERVELRQRQSEEVADAQKDLSDAYAKMSQEHKDLHAKIAQRIDQANQDLSQFENDLDTGKITVSARENVDSAIASAKQALANANARKDDLIRSTETGWDNTKKAADDSVDQLEKKVKEAKAMVSKKFTKPNPRDRDPTPRYDYDYGK